MGRLVLICARIAGSARFQAVTFAAILANGLVIGLQTYDSFERAHGSVLDTLNAVFLTFFVIEIVIRITSFGRRPWRFFGEGWNVFDFVMVAPALIPGVRENVTALRVVRLLRVSGWSAPCPRCAFSCRGSGAASRP